MAANPKTITIKISPGEAIDRLTILRIKLEHITGEAKLANVRSELESLELARGKKIPDTPEIKALEADLEAINARLWNIEDEIRDCERGGEFGPHFIELARAVYRINDERARIKREINQLLGAGIVEEKSYTPY